MQITLDQITNKLELHYYLRDGSHSMNAFSRNKCEQELLYIFREVARILDLDIEIESEAFAEGGLKEFWKFLGKNSPQLTLIVIIIAAILTRYPVSNETLDALKETELSLSIEEKKLNIEKLKKDLRDQENESTAPKKEINIEPTIEIVNDHLKIRKHKSNFYGNLLNNRKVTRISTNCLTDNNQQLLDDTVIERRDFYKFILKTDNLAPLIDDEANIEIISPVLKKGNFKWKGIYNNEIITFYMKDSVFKESVIQNGIQFKCGTFIDCVLEQSRKVDTLGEIVVSGYAVTTVIKKYDDIESFNTPQGKKYKLNKKIKDSQLALFNNNNSK